jgi:hypothetical protein
VGQGFFGGGSRIGITQYADVGVDFGNLMVRRPIEGHPGSGTRGGSHLEPRELLLGTAAAAATYAIGHANGVAVAG